ncbi:MAG: PilZ domain-containing protein [Gammaproteobacteria bacterium]|nr:PilZ domain-containing protein [Gammaproteobacteria bacterium]
MSAENHKNNGVERRQYQRIPFHAEIMMQSGNVEWTCNLLDISLNGMLVEPPRNIKINPNKPCAVALFLSDDVIINARARIKHTSDDRWGLQYINIDTESLEHLRHLLESILKDSNLIDRDLTQLG